MKIDLLRYLAAATVVATLGGCSSSNNMPAAPPSTPSAPQSVIAQLATTTTIGTTVDATNGDTNPYGLAIAPITVGAMTAGDLVVCNFNSSDPKNGAGMGTTIEDLSPVAGSKPKRIAQDPSLAGCDALAINPTAGNIWAAAYTANDNPIFKPTGALATSLATNYKWMKPWGQIFGSPTLATGSTATPPSAFFITDAADGSVVQANITASGLVFNKIISGFPQLVDPKYGILAPAGLTYDPASDTLYVVSSYTDSVLAFSAVSTIPSDGITIAYTPPTTTAGLYGSNSTAASFAFTGPNAAQAKVIATGGPLNYPISSALLYNGDLIVGNTGDNNLLEITPSTGKVVGQRLVDTGNSGAIFGIATSGTSVATQKIYFNNDNTNSIVEISQ